MIHFDSEMEGCEMHLKIELNFDENKFYWRGC